MKNQDQSEDHSNWKYVYFIPLNSVDARNERVRQLTDNHKSFKFYEFKIWKMFLSIFPLDFITIESERASEHFIIILLSFYHHFHFNLTGRVVVVFVGDPEPVCSVQNSLDNRSQPSYRVNEPL